MWEAIRNDVGGLVRGLACSAGVVLAGCGGGSHASTGSPDASPDAPPDASAQTVTLRLALPAQLPNLTLIAFRDGLDAPWQMPTVTGAGSYEIAVHGPYTVENVCAVPGSALTLEQSRTLDDPRELTLLCLNSVTAPAPALSHVTGSMGSRGVISVGFQQVVTPDGQFDVQVPDGTYDVIARTQPLDNTGDQVVIRRNLVVSGNTVVTPDINFAAEGTATMLVHPTVTNQISGEAVSMVDQIITPTASSAVNSTSAADVRVVPDAALGPHDTQSIVLVAVTQLSQRVITRSYTAATSVAFTLPPAMAVQYATTGGRSTVTWTTLPPFDGLGFEIFQSDMNSAGRSTSHTLELSASYVAAVGATSAAFDTDLPGFEPGWRFDPAIAWSLESHAGRIDGGDTVSSFFRQNVVP